MCQQNNLELLTNRLSVFVPPDPGEVLTGYTIRYYCLLTPEHLNERKVRASCADRELLCSPVC